MRLAPAASLAAFVLAAVPAAAQPPEGTAPPIVVQGEALARTEIERILEADNLDTARLPTRDVLAAMRAIERGRAPEDFWAAYQAHLRAWEAFAEVEARIEARAEALMRGKGQELSEAIAALEAADRAINTTFDEVERIARRYDARLPVPHAEPLPTV